MNPAVAVNGGAVSAKILAIRELTRLGYTLIPTKGKIPVDKNWEKTPFGKYGEKNLEGNYGILLREDDLVIDVDPRNISAADNNPLSRLMKDIGGTPDTLMDKTGGNGLHIFLKKPDPEILVANTVAAYGKGIEFKSAGRQVIGPGSIHPETGKEYAVVLTLGGKPKANPFRVEKAPQALMDIVKKTAVPYAELTEGEKAGTGEYKNDAQTQGRYVSYLQHSAEPSIEGKGGDAVAFKVAAHGRDLALPPSTTLELMLDIWNPRCSPPWDKAELKTKVINAYKYAQGAVGGAHPAADFTPVPMPLKAPVNPADVAWDLDGKGNIRKNFLNLLNHLNFPVSGLYKCFGLNEFTGQIMVTNPLPWHNGKMPKHLAVGDHDLKLLKAHLATGYEFEAPVTVIEEAVTCAAHSNKFHPIREYLTSLKWDGKERLDHWLRDYGGAADDVYTRAVARKALCAAVRRVFHPGCKYDHVLVLEGAQGIGKSGLCQILGGPWYGDFVIDPHNKDTIQLMQGKWIIELAELEVNRRSEADAVKAFISRQVDTARLAYGRLAAEFPRQSSFIATMNPGPDGTYLKDDTGNRRWWPVMLHGLARLGGMVDFAGLKANRDQIFAEAVIRVTAGEKLFMDTVELKALSTKEVGERHADHPWSERVAMWLDGLAPDRVFVTSRDVFIEALGGVDKQFGRRETVAIAASMRAQGWLPGYGHIGDRTVRGYLAPKSANQLLGDLV